MNSVTALDCRGQRCPGPILAVAKLARRLGTAGGGTIHVQADDDAFPFDIRSWCRSSGAELLELEGGSGVHSALVRVKPSEDSVAVPVSVPVPVPVPVPVETTPSDTVAATLDYRGQRCPGPVVNLARDVQTWSHGETIDVLADDPAFPMDVKSWSRSAGATVVSLSDEPEGAVRARLRLPAQEQGAPAQEQGAPVQEQGFVEDIPTVVPIPEPRGDAKPDVIRLHDVKLDERWAVIESVAQERGVRQVVVEAEPGFAHELMRWSLSHGHTIHALTLRDVLRVELELKSGDAPSVAPVASVEPEQSQCTLLVMHNDREALLAALLIAVGAASQGMSVMMYFTFWGLNLLRGERPNELMESEPVTWMQRLLKWMMPPGPHRQKLGKLHMAGLGSHMMGSIMKHYELMDIPELMNVATELEVRFVACTMSMQVMGITKRDLAPFNNLEYGGVAAFVEAAARSRVSLTF